MYKKRPRHFSCYIRQLRDRSNLGVHLHNFYLLAFLVGNTTEQAHQDRQLSNSLEYRTPAVLFSKYLKTRYTNTRTQTNAAGKRV